MNNPHDPMVEAALSTWFGGLNWRHELPDTSDQCVEWMRHALATAFKMMSERLPLDIYGLPRSDFQAWLRQIAAELDGQSDE